MHKKNEIMKYCSNCGAELYDDAQFCTKCGKSLSKDSENINTRKEPKVNKKAIYAFLVVIGVLLMIVFGAMYYSDYTEKREIRLAREKFVADSLEQVRKDSIKLAGLKEQARKDSIENARILSLQKPYLDILNKYGTKEDHWGEFYFLYDLNGDDFPEMWLQVLEGDEYKILVYSNFNGEAKLLFRKEVGHPYHHSFHKGDNYILLNYGHMGSQEICKYYFEKGLIKEKSIFTLEADSSDEAKYKDVSEPEVSTFDITDKSPIYELK